MEKQIEQIYYKRQRKRVLCNVCNGNIIQRCYKMHRTRCEFLATLTQCSDKIMQQKYEKTTQHEQSDPNQENCQKQQEQNQKIQERNIQNEQNGQQKLELLYHNLINHTKEEKQEQNQTKNEMFKLEHDHKQHQQLNICDFCGHQTKNLRVHEEYCQSRQNYCQFCGQQFSVQTMPSHHKICEQNRRIKRIQLLMQDSDQEEQQPPSTRYDEWPGYRSDSSDQQYEVEGSSNINPRYDDVYQYNPYVRNNQGMWHDSDLIYTHRPPLPGSPYYSIQVAGIHRALYRYRRQYLPPPIRRVQEVDKELQQRVTQSLTRFGYGADSINRLREHRNYQNYLRMIDEFIDGNSQNQFTQGMNEYQMEKIVRKKYNKQKMKQQKQDDMCAICYSEFEENDDIMQLICHHYFHEYCVKKWLEVNFRCPICKFPQVCRKIQIQS